jgi:hypothetical protein
VYSIVQRGIDQCISIFNIRSITSVKCNHNDLLGSSLIIISSHGFPSPHNSTVQYKHWDLVLDIGDLQHSTIVATYTQWAAGGLVPRPRPTLERGLGLGPDENARADE